MWTIDPQSCSLNSTILIFEIRKLSFHSQTNVPDLRERSIKILTHVSADGSNSKIIEPIIKVQNHQLQISK